MNKSEKPSWIEKIPDSYLVPKSSSFIHQTLNPDFAVSATQAKVLNAVQYQLQKKIMECNITTQEFLNNHKGNLEVSIKSELFRKLIKCESRNTEYIKSVMKEMQRLSYQTDSLSKNGKTGKFEFVNFFVKASYTARHFVFKMPEEATKHLIGDSVSAVVDVLSVAQNFGSKYSFWLYDLIEEKAHYEQADDFTFIINDETLRNGLKVPFKMEAGNKVYSYKQPKQLARRAIDKVVEELKSSNLRLEIKSYSYSKHNGEYYWYFEIESKKSKLIAEYSQQYSMELDVIRKSLVSIGVSNKAIDDYINKVASDRDRDYLSFNINIVKAQMKAGKVRNPAALFVAAMRNNLEAHSESWKDIKVKQEMIKEAKRAEYQRSILENRINRKIDLVNEKSESTIRLIKSSNDQKWLSLLKEEFVDHLHSMPLDSAKKLSKKLEENGFTPEDFENALFIKFIHQRIEKDITERELEDYIEAVGTKIQI